MRGARGVASNFWNNMKDTPFVRKRPYIKPSMWEKLIPLGLDGDGGQFSDHDGLFVFSMNSLLCRTTTRSSRMVLTIVKKSLIIPATLDAIAKVLCWSFNVLMTGIEASCDWEHRNNIHYQGQFLASGYRAVLTQIRGDWEFFASVFGTPKWNEIGRMCWLCGAVGDDTSPLKCTDCSEEAPWRDTRVTHEAYMASATSIPIWFLLIVGFRVECIMVDLLHSLDLGFGSHIVGNIFWDCVMLKA